MAHSGGIGVSVEIQLTEDMHMKSQTNKLIYLAIIPLAVVAILSSVRPNGLYQRVSFLLLTTASMEAAANGGAIGENLPNP